MAVTTVTGAHRLEGFQTLMEDKTMAEPLRSQQWVWGMEAEQEVGSKAEIRVNITH